MCVTIVAKYGDDRVSIKHQKLEKVDLTEPIDTPTNEYSTLELSFFSVGGTITTNNEVTKGNNKHRYCGVDW